MATVAPSDLDAASRVSLRRVVQYFFDVFLIGLVLALIGLLAQAVAPDAGIALVNRGPVRVPVLTGDGWGSAAATVITIAVWAAVFVVLPRSTGRTPLMALLGLRVVDADGGPASTGQHVTRALFLVVDTLAAGLVGLAVMRCSRRRQRVGDHVAGTLVIQL